MEPNFPWSHLTGDGISTGKGIDAFKKSKRGRNELIAMFGGPECVPSSVMKAKKIKADAEADEPAANRTYRSTSVLNGPTYSQKKLPGVVLKSAGMSGSGSGAGALSVFPQDIGRSIVLFYSEPGCTVFDPFAGHNSRMELCIKAGRNYIGCDLSATFMEFNRRKADKLRKRYPKLSIELHEGDSRSIPAADECGDFTITSPPYYRQEWYGDEPEQMYNCPSYKDFLREMQKVLAENLRCLKPGAYAVWFVNDFRNDGVMHFYHADLIRLARKAGFIAHDILIVDFGRGFGDCFLNRMMERRQLPKRHEYGLVFRKPDNE